MSSQPQFKGTLLVTGGGGFVGAHIVRAALAKGYAVRLTARTASSAEKAVALHPQYAGTAQLTTAVVPDITDVSSYEPVLDGAVTGVIHSASPFNVSPADNVRDLLEPAVRGSTVVLEATRRWGARVRRVVVTSSFGAICDLARGKQPGHVYTEADWNPTSWNAAAVADGVVAYCASKSLAERAAWDCVDQQKQQQQHPVNFDLVAICPPWVFGPYVGGIRDTKHLSESIALLAGIIDAPEVPPFDFGGFADAREVAEAHIRALEVPEAGGQRFLVGQDYRYQLAIDSAREAIPELRGRLPEGRPGYVEPAYSVDGSKASKVLGLEYRTLAETIKDTYEQLLRAKKNEEKA